jgi:hypothetical protein
MHNFTSDLFEIFRSKFRIHLYLRKKSNYTIIKSLTNLRSRDLEETNFCLNEREPFFHVVQNVLKIALNSVKKKKNWAKKKCYCKIDTTYIHTICLRRVYDGLRHQCM